MNSCLLLSLCISVFLIIELCQDCQGYPEHQQVHHLHYHDHQRHQHLGEHHLDPEKTSSPFSNPNNDGRVNLEPMAYRDPTVSLVRRAVDENLVPWLQQFQNSEAFVNGLSSSSVSQILETPAAVGKREVEDLSSPGINTSLMETFNRARELLDALLTTSRNLSNEMSVGPQTSTATNEHQQRIQMLRELKRNPNRLSDILQESVPTLRINSLVRELIKSLASLPQSVPQSKDPESIPEPLKNSENQKTVAPPVCICVPQEPSSSKKPLGGPNQSESPGELKSTGSQRKLIDSYPVQSGSSNGQREPGTAGGKSWHGYQRILVIPGRIRDSESENESETPSGVSGSKSQNRQRIPSGASSPESQSGQRIPTRTSSPGFQNESEIPNGASGEESPNRHGIPSRAKGPGSRSRQRVPSGASKPGSQNESEILSGVSRLESPNSKEIPSRANRPRSQSRQRIPGRTSVSGSQSESEVLNEGSGLESPNSQRIPSGQNGPGSRTRQRIPSGENGPGSRTRQRIPSGARNPESQSRQRIPSRTSRPGFQNESEIPNGVSGSESPNRQRIPSRAKRPESRSRQRVPSGASKPGFQNESEIPSGVSRLESPNSQGIPSRANGPGSQSRQRIPSGANIPGFRSESEFSDREDILSGENGPGSQTRQRIPSGTNIPGFLNKLKIPIGLLPIRKVFSEREDIPSGASSPESQSRQRIPSGTSIPGSRNELKIPIRVSGSEFPDGERIPSGTRIPLFISESEILSGVSGSGSLNKQRIPSGANGPGSRSRQRVPSGSIGKDESSVPKYARILLPSRIRIPSEKIKPGSADGLDKPELPNGSGFSGDVSRSASGPIHPSWAYYARLPIYPGWPGLLGPDFQLNTLGESIPLGPSGRLWSLNGQGMKFTSKSETPGSPDGQKSPNGAKWYLFAVLPNHPSGTDQLGSNFQLKSLGKPNIPGIVLPVLPLNYHQESLSSSGDFPKTILSLKVLPTSGSKSEAIEAIEGIRQLEYPLKLGSHLQSYLEESHPDHESISPLRKLSLYTLLHLKDPLQKPTSRCRRMPQVEVDSPCLSQEQEPSTLPRLMSSSLRNRFTLEDLYPFPMKDLCPSSRYKSLPQPSPKSLLQPSFQIFPIDLFSSLPKTDLKSPSLHSPVSTFQDASSTIVPCHKHSPPSFKFITLPMEGPSAVERETLQEQVSLLTKTPPCSPVEREALQDQVSLLTKTQPCSPVKKPSESELTLALLRTLKPVQTPPCSPTKEPPACDLAPACERSLLLAEPSSLERDSLKERASLLTQIPPRSGSHSQHLITVFPIVQMMPVAREQSPAVKSPSTEFSPETESINLSSSIKSLIMSSIKASKSETADENTSVPPSDEHLPHSSDSCLPTSTNHRSSPTPLFSDPSPVSPPCSSCRNNFPRQSLPYVQPQNYGQPPAMTISLPPLPALNSLISSAAMIASQTNSPAPTIINPVTQPPTQTVNAPCPIITTVTSTPTITTPISQRPTLEKASIEDFTWPSESNDSFVTSPQKKNHGENKEHHIKHDKEQNKEHNKEHNKWHKGNSNGEHHKGHNKWHKRNKDEEGNKEHNKSDKGNNNGEHNKEDNKEHNKWHKGKKD